MKKELDEYLVKKYPLIFRDRYESMQKTAMCWGFDCSDHWFFIIDNLCESIQTYINNHNEWKLPAADPLPQVVATQVKEKFGMLEFYCNMPDRHISGMIHLATNMSYHTCEFCGSIKDVGHTKGWVYTICKECYDNSIEDRVKQLKWEL